MGPSYQYKAVIERWVDADTIDMLVDLGFETLVKKRFRLLNIDAPERYTTAGKEAIVWINENYPVGSKVIARTYMDGNTDKYGRWLADVYLVGSTVSASDLLVAEGHAVYKEY